MFFISSKKPFSFSRYSNFCIFLSSFPHFPDLKGQMEVEQFMMSWIGLHKFADAIFGITQKPLYIVSSNLIKQNVLVSSYLHSWWYHKLY